MKKVINIISYVLSGLLIAILIFGAIYFLVDRNNKRKEIPTLAEAIEKYDLPILEINGDMNGISKENKVDVKVKYHSDELNFDSNATLKWQGASSLAYEKKNYTITFVDELGEKNKIKVKDEWGEQSKYCLKANYIDYSSARNVVSAKIYGDVVHSRAKDDKLNDLVNGGAIDGFPVLIYTNNSYHGLYTFNIPKDKWLFNMKSKDYKAILMADQWSESTRLNDYISEDFLSSGWEVEYSSTEDGEGNAWVNKSFNNLIKFVKENDGDNFKANISNYVDVDRTIDTMLYTLAINANDNLSKNILWVTYDGTTWVPSAYDLDGTWGIDSSGNLMNQADWLTLEKFASSTNTNLLWKKILTNYKQEVKVRYQELRQSVLSFENINQKFSNFVSQIPTEIYNFDAVLYSRIPSQKLSDLSQILYFAQNNLKNIDVEFAAL